MSSEASDWTIGKLLDWTARHLLESGISEARLDTEILLATAIQGRRIDLYAQHTRSATAEERARFREMVRRRLQHEPVAYITGKREFYGLELKVNNRVLVPRPETELVVDEARAWLKGKPNAKVLDVGTGSGAIVLAILKHAPQTTGAAIDISPEALDVARENAATHGLNTRLTCRVGSLLQPLQEGEVYDVITANLPYIPTLDIAGLAPEVRREPVLALDGGADGLDQVSLLVSQAATHLVPGGRLVLEIGAHPSDQCQVGLPALDQRAGAHAALMGVPLTRRDIGFGPDHACALNACVGVDTGDAVNEQKRRCRKPALAFEPVLSEEGGSEKFRHLSARRGFDFGTRPGFADRRARRQRRAA